MALLAAGLVFYVPGGTDVLRLTPGLLPAALAAFVLCEGLAFLLTLELERHPRLQSRLHAGAAAFPHTLRFMVLAATVGALEEMFFRGWFLSAVIHPMHSPYHIALPYWLSVTVIGLLSALVFGAGHVRPKIGFRPNLLFFAYASLTGLLYFGLSLWAGTVWVAVIAHGVYNLVEYPVSQRRDAGAARLVHKGA